MVPKGETEMTIKHPKLVLAVTVLSLVACMAVQAQAQMPPMAGAPAVAAGSPVDPAMSTGTRSPEAKVTIRTQYGLRS